MRCAIKLKQIVDIGRIRQNIEFIKSKCGVKVMLMLKADAYGHGLEQIALCLQDDVFAYGVATCEEGVTLRHIGVRNDVLVLFCALDEIEVAIKHNLTIALTNCLQVAKIVSLAKDGAVDKSQVRLHLALDTGMHRLGFEMDEINCVLSRLADCNLSVQGVYSHLYGDGKEQVDDFERACERVRAVFPNAIRHLSSSHSYQDEKMRFDMVRIGLDAYKGAMRVESRVIATRQVEKGERISYGNYIAPRRTNVAVVFGGYADGISREHPSSVYINNQKCVCVGDVCMDMTIVDTADMLARVGDKVTLFDGEHDLEIAKERNTILYNVYTSFKGRVQREYL